MEIPSSNNNNDYDEDDDDEKKAREEESRGRKNPEYSCHQSYECESNNRHAAKSLYYPSLVVA